MGLVWDLRGSVKIRRFFWVGFRSIRFDHFQVSCQEGLVDARDKA